MFALDIPYLITGAVFIETIFSWPGMGRLYYQSAMQRDYPVLMAILIISGALMILSNLGSRYTVRILGSQNSI